MSARKLSDEERRQAIAYCDFYGGWPFVGSGLVEASPIAVDAVRTAYAWSQISAVEAWPWVGAAALLRAGWSPGESPTSAQRLAAAAQIVIHILAETDADVTIRCDVTPAVGAAMAGPVTATYTITATGDAP